MSYRVSIERRGKEVRVDGRPCTGTGLFLDSGERIRVVGVLGGFFEVVVTEPPGQEEAFRARIKDGQKLVLSKEFTTWKLEEAKKPVAARDELVEVLTAFDLPANLLQHVPCLPIGLRGPCGDRPEHTRDGVELWRERKSSGGLRERFAGIRTDPVCSQDILCRALTFRIFGQEIPWEELKKLANDAAAAVSWRKQKVRVEPAESEGADQYTYDSLTALLGTPTAGGESFTIRLFTEVAVKRGRWEAAVLDWLIKKHGPLAVLAECLNDQHRELVKGHEGTADEAASFLLTLFCFVVFRRKSDPTPLFQMISSAVGTDPFELTGKGPCQPGAKPFRETWYAKNSPVIKVLLAKHGDALVQAVVKLVPRSNVVQQVSIFPQFREVVTHDESLFGIDADGKETYLGPSCDFVRFDLTEDQLAQLHAASNVVELKMDGLDRYGVSAVLGCNDEGYMLEPTPDYILRGLATPVWLYLPWSSESAQTQVGVYDLVIGTGRGENGARFQVSTLVARRSSLDAVEFSWSEPQDGSFVYRLLASGREWPTPDVVCTGRKAVAA